MEIDPQAVNNFQSLPPPPSGGAARVKPYQTGNYLPMRFIPASSDDF